MDPNDSPAAPESDLAPESASGFESPEELGFAFGEEDEAYEPGFFARLTANPWLVILLVVAFLLLVLSPWLYYALYPPRPRPPEPIERRGLPVLYDGDAGEKPAQTGLLRGARAAARSAGDAVALSSRVGA